MAQTSSSTPPSGAQNKQPLAAATSSGTGSTLPTGNSVADILARNAALQVRRDAGEVGVPADEDIPPQPAPSRPSTPPQKIALTQVYAALATCSPASQKIIRDTLNSTLNEPITTLTSSSTPILIYSVANESAASTSHSSGYGIHPYLVTLANNGFHLPLTLFTTASTNRLHTNEATIVHKPVFNRAGVKRHIMDVSHFPIEGDMDVADWHEAWNRYLVFVGVHGEADISKRWKEHFSFLSGQDNFKLNFPAILRFDIEIRTKYAIEPRHHDEDAYRRRFEAVKLEVLQESLRKAAVESDTRSYQTKAKRFTPYSPGPFETTDHPLPIPPSASSVNEITNSLNAKKRHRRQANKRSRNAMVEASFAVPTAVPSAPLSTSAGIPLVVTTPSLHSAALLITELVPAVAPNLQSPSITSALTASLRNKSLLDIIQSLSFNPALVTKDRVPYFNSLTHIETPYDHDSDFVKSITPYSAEAFQVYLLNAQIVDQYPELCFKLLHGFPLGELTPLTTSFTPPNLPSAVPYTHVIRDYIQEELRLARFSGPFTKTHLETKIGPFRSSPVQVVVKPGAPGQPDKFRCCRNLSYRGNLHFSINDDINPDKYPTRWGTALECAKIVSEAPVGTQACTLDIEGAYRTIPVWPNDKRYLIVQFEASGLQGEVADAIVDIWHALNVGPVIKWVDDFNVFRHPSSGGPFLDVSAATLYRYDYDLDYIKAMIAPLGVPWHDTKGSPFGDTFSYVGFEWNLPQKTVYLTLAKREKHRTKVLSFIQQASSSQFLKKEVESLYGSLSHISFVYQRGKAYLTNIISWLPKFPNDFTPRWALPSVISDLKWWLNVLSIPSTFRCLSPRPPTADLGIWVDASTDWGIGLLLEGRWDAWQTLPTAIAPGRDIGWLEGVAIELIILILQASPLLHQDILIRSDNEGVIGAFRKGWSHNRETNESIRRSGTILDDSNLSFTFIYTNASPFPTPFLYPYRVTFAMPKLPEPSLADKLEHVNINAELAAFSANVNALSPSPILSQPISPSVQNRIPRKPRKGNTVKPSIFRPPVLASERLQHWTTPHSLSFRHSISSALPSSDLSRLFEVMSFSLDQGTRDGYGAGLLRFTQYCDQAGIPEANRMPASDVLLSVFIATLGAGKVATSTTRKGVTKLVPISSKRAKRPPVTIEHLYALRKGLDLTNTFDIAVWAIACIAFWSCCRLGELTIPSSNLFDPIKHAARSAPTSFRTTAMGTEFATCHIPWTKTTMREGADISITARADDPSCPVAAFKHHLANNTSVPASASLFAYETADGCWAPMTKSWFMARCNEVWVAAGLPDMPGHGFRIGGATHLLLMGTPPDIVAVQGRWKLRAFLEYWRKIESILPLFLSNANSASRFSLIEDSMKQYQKKWKL
ncbi:unnamed protein product [Cyclocybe aegerita]|uniref:Uncharacterized protein n=1 Tax=Cyclocybe aegerita TaxID=1973307 RepID=A0A8S0Y0P2_CYCAE|nr:unnamed protein product [Cyclocybe aegerita]